LSFREIPDDLRNTFSFVDVNSDRYVEDLQELIRQPSISAQNKGVKECAEILQSKMKEAGIEAKIMSTARHPIVFGEVKGNGAKKTLLFYGHYDVQPPEPVDEWLSPPFAAEIRDGRVYGRGASDMKCGIMAVVEGIGAYLKTNSDLPVNVKIIFEGEEEISSPSLEPFLRQNRTLLSADALCGYDGTSEVRLGCKGMLYVQLTFKEDRIDFHSREAGILVSPVWRLVWALSTLKDRAERILIDGFYDGVQNPTPEDDALLEAMPYDPNDLYSGRLLEGLDTKMKIFKRRLFSPTCNISGIVSGYTGAGSKTVLPRVATAKLDFRLVPDQDPNDLLEKLRRHFVKHGMEDIEIAELGKLWPARTHPSEDIAKTVIRSAEIAHGHKVAVTPIGAGSGPHYLFSTILNVPFAHTGAATSIKVNHAPNEFVKVEDYISGIKKAAAIVYNFGG
jgi:acetylornithine deacetylase/succinyl-diaminopimelate desuccinylase-like protein